MALPDLFAFFGLPVVDERTAGTGAETTCSPPSGPGVISVMLFSFGAGVAAERGRKTDVLMRATPLRPAVLFCAKTLSALSSPPSRGPLLLREGRGRRRARDGRLVDPDLPLAPGLHTFIFLGFAVGYLARPTSAAPVIQLIYLPIAFASGLFVPLGTP